MATSPIAKAAAALADKASDGYHTIESTVTNGYKAVENTVVNRYTKLEDAFVARYLQQDGETLAEAKKRLKKNP